MLWCDHHFGDHPVYNSGKDLIRRAEWVKYAWTGAEARPLRRAKRLLHVLGCDSIPFSTGRSQKWWWIFQTSACNSWWFHGAVWARPFNLKGDWPTLAKLGNLQQHFLKHGRPKTNSAMCHLCKARMVGVDYEENDINSKWYESNLQERPRSHPCDFMRLPLPCWLCSLWISTMFP